MLISLEESPIRFSARPCSHALTHRYTSLIRNELRGGARKETSAIPRASFWIILKEMEYITQRRSWSTGTDMERYYSFVRALSVLVGSRPYARAAANTQQATSLIRGTRFTRKIKARPFTYRQFPLPSVDSEFLTSHYERADSMLAYSVAWRNVACAVRKFGQR